MHRLQSTVRTRACTPTKYLDDAAPFHVGTSRRVIIVFRYTAGEIRVVSTERLSIVPVEPWQTAKDISVL